MARCSPAAGAEQDAISPSGAPPPGWPADALAAFLTLTVALGWGRVGAIEGQRHVHDGRMLANTRWRPGRLTQSCSRRCIPTLIRALPTRPARPDCLTGAIGPRGRLKERQPARRGARSRPGSPLERRPAGRRSSLAVSGLGACHPLPSAPSRSAIVPGARGGTRLGFVELLASSGSVGGDARASSGRRYPAAPGGRPRSGGSASTAQRRFPAAAVSGRPPGAG
jgi:hypothetical protein